MQIALAARQPARRLTIDAPGSIFSLLAHRPRQPGVLHCRPPRHRHGNRASAATTYRPASVHQEPVCALGNDLQLIWGIGVHAGSHNMRCRYAADSASRAWLWALCMRKPANPENPANRRMDTGFVVCECFANRCEHHANRGVPAVAVYMPPPCES